MRSFTGTKRLIRLALRRDRIVLPVTIVIVLAMVAGSAPALISAYPDYETQLVYVSTSAPSVVGRIFQGTVQGPSLGTILMAETFLFSAVIVAIMSIFLITRHTRHNEETGAGELISSSVVGKNAPLTAALSLAVATNLVIGLLMFASLSANKEFDTTGSAYFALSLSMVGIFFAGVASVTSQLSDYRRGANTMAMSIMGLFFLLRGFGDALGELSADKLSVTPTLLTWLSPIGWGYQVYPFNGNRVMPLILLIVASASVTILGYVLLHKRDLGSSIFDTKPGSNRAKASLLSVGGLTKRLQRGGLYVWGVAFVAVGILVGVMPAEFKSVYEDNDLFAEYLESTGASGNLTKIIIASMFASMASIAAGYAVSSLSKMQDEESSGRIEYLMGTALSKSKWMLSHVVFLIVGLVSIVATMGLVAGISYTIAAETTEVSITEMVLASLINIPALVIFSGVLLLLFSLRGRFVKSFGWGYFTYCVLIGSLAAIFKWPQWISNMSPFTHSPAAPSDTINFAPLYTLTIVAILLIIISIALFRRRDLSLK